MTIQDIEVAVGDIVGGSRENYRIVHETACNRQNIETDVNNKTIEYKVGE